MIEILLATYNSSRYIREQIDSIIAQTYKDWQLLVHDGGSTDDTVDIIKDYEQKDSRIAFVGQERLTSVGNFAKLWKLSRKGYIMFSDHDDVWLPNKIEVQLKAMQKAETETPNMPILVFSDAKVVDGELKPLCDSSWAWQGLDPKRVELRQLLFQNVAAGNNMLINPALAQKIGEIPTSVVMHDQWVILVAAALGCIVRVDEPLLLYRQHGNNVLGATRFSPAYFQIKLQKGVQSVRDRVNEHMAQGALLGEMYAGEITGRDEKMLKALKGFSKCSWLARRFIVLRYGIWKCGFARNLGMLIIM